MISKSAAEAYVWIWLPGSDNPVVAGRLEAVGDIYNFNYGRSYLERADAISLYGPELPLRRGLIAPPRGASIAGCIADAGPDAWGRRVIRRKLSVADDADDPGLLTFLLASDSDRIGAIDFQISPEAFVSRDEASAPLEELVTAAERVEEGVAFSPALDQALIHGSSVGGARPKALLDDGTRKLIAKFSSSTDQYAVVKGEFAAMELARRVGLNVAAVDFRHVLDKDVLLVERFDRMASTQQRRSVVSAATILGLGDTPWRGASYSLFAESIRHDFRDGAAAVVELFGRIVFNILVGNTDDHAHNHAALWDGRQLTLSPAFDICPQPRAGGEAVQAMAISRSGFRYSRIDGCVAAAGEYLLSETQAREIIDRQVEIIRENWDVVSDQAHMTATDKSTFWGRQFLNRYAFETTAG
jgi:serine/threonine-protein kinase HipA